MPDTPTIALRSAAITDIGRVRRQNEDRFLRSEEHAFFAVADGIGGLPGGAAAAQACIDALHAGAESLAALSALADLVPLMHAANRRVLALAERVSPQLGMGSTLLCGAVRGDRLLLSHVGDSRCYLIRAGTARRLTLDHSLANDLARIGGPLPADLDDYQLSALTRCIGQLEPPEVDLIEERLRPGDLVLLATDGVSRVVPDAELATQLGGSAAPAARLSQLIRTVNQRGAPDNATAILLLVD